MSNKQTQLNKIKQQIKSKIEKNKKYFLIATIAMSGLSVSQKADAQEGPFRNDCTFVYIHDLMGIQTQDSRVFFSAEELAAAMRGISPEKYKAFQKAYEKKLDKDLKVAPIDLINAFKEAGLNEQEIIMAVNQMKNQQSDIGKTPQEIVFTKIKNSNASLEYACFNRDEMIVRGSVSTNLNTLLPNVYQDNLGGFRCGASIGPDAATVIKKEKLALQDIVLRNEVYKYLQNKDKNDMNTAEQNFFNHFPEQLSAHGLSFDKKGNLVQKDYIERLQKAKSTQRN